MKLQPDHVRLVFPCSLFGEQSVDHDIRQDARSLKLLYDAWMEFFKKIDAQIGQLFSIRRVPHQRRFLFCSLHELLHALLGRECHQLGKNLLGLR